MDEFFHSGSRVRYIWLIANPCAMYNNSQIHSELRAGEIVKTAAWNLCWCNLVQHWYSSWNGTLSLQAGGRAESSRTKHGLSGMRALVITNVLPGSWVTITIVKPRVMTCVILHGLLFIIAWDVLNCWNLRHVLLVCLRISNAEFMKLQKTKAHLNISSIGFLKRRHIRKSLVIRRNILIFKYTGEKSIRK